MQLMLLSQFADFMTFIINHYPLAVTIQQNIVLH